MAMVNNKPIIRPVLITLLFLAGLIAAHAYPTSTVCNNSNAVTIYTRDYRHQNGSFESLDSLFMYADALNIWRYSQNCSGCC
jgi:hypothetical protein